MQYVGVDLTVGVHPAVRFETGDSGAGFWSGYSVYCTVVVTLTGQLLLHGRDDIVAVVVVTILCRRRGCGRIRGRISVIAVAIGRAVGVSGVTISVARVTVPVSVWIAEAG